ncbi:hypothetical protein B0H15DRAFT_814411 [Mycena belliarum]|uniref:GYF domain-containing protein n=1 Tax=Mycena belliarum TaxID=1033014 RepID=A0AAD6UKQ7_9AGAR|nr:hypothetical protein B0H15DRAFT_814411 [Mycena belliae]
MSLHSASSMQFGPEWMRAKPAKPHGPSSPPPATAPAAGASSYSALVSPAPPPPAEKRDDTHPFRYSRDEMLKIYRDGGGKGGLGLEVERWEGIVREVGSEPVGLREMGESEKKLFAGSLNSELRRRQSIDYLSPLATQGTTGERPRLPHSTSASGTGSPLRERFGGLMRRRDSSDQLSPTVPRKLSLSSAQAPLSPRDAALPSPRTRIGHTPTFDGVLNGGESWVARRRASEAKAIGNASRDEGRGPELREEDEDANLDSGGNAAPQDLPQTKPSPSRDPPTVQPKTDEAASYSPHLKNGADLKATAVANGPSPGMVDLPSVQWSYLDPQGQLQGPFRADLMQKWYDDGYFTADLLMKRTHVDINWVAVGDLAELARLSGSEKLFLAPPIPSGPPGLSRPPDLAGQSFNASGEQNTYTAPLQPAPVRSLRSSTLDSYVGGSSHSDSPSSSFGAGRFGNGSPDPNGFGGRANQYSTDPAIGGRFGIPSESSSSLRRNTFTDPSMDPSTLGSRFAGGDAYTNGTYSPSQGPWHASSSNPLGPTFDAMGGNFGSSQHLNPGLGGSAFGHIRAPHDPTFGDVAPVSFPEFVGSPQAGGSYGPGQQYSQLHSSQFASPQTPATASNMYGQPSKPSLPHPAIQNSGMPTVPTQSPWGAVPDPSTARRAAAPFDSAPRTAAPNVINRPTTPVQTSPWGAAVQTTEPSPWFAASHGIIDESSWKEERGHSLTFDNLGQHNQQFTITPEDALKATPVPPNEGARPTEIDAGVPTKPAAAAPPPQPAKTRTKSTSQAVAPPPIAPTIPAAESTPQVLSAPQKAAWSKEEEAKRSKPSGVTLGLREIQEAEAKKAEARKVAERDRDRAVRASSSTVPAPEEAAQPFTASWGLPTSQAGARAPPAKEPAATSSPSAGAVWTNTTKPTATKKTMKEIQEEEEKRKKTATKETTAAAARRAYAESTSKVRILSFTNPAPAPARPPAAPAAPSTSTPVPRANGAVAPRAAPVPVKAPAPRVEDHPATASHEFVRWLNDSLKGLNSSVNVEEIMSMLLSFPLDPDVSTVELISDLIYANSTTLDGRRFAAEFVSKRKTDAASRPKGASVPGTVAGKPVSIADVVKAQPKAPASSEWVGLRW